MDYASLPVTHNPNGSERRDIVPSGKLATGEPVHIHSSMQPAGTPPALIMQGTADDNLTPDMAADFAAAYTKAGGSIAFHKFEGQPHAFIPRDPASPDARRALELITDFIHHQTR